MAIEYSISFGRERNEGWYNSHPSRPTLCSKPHLLHPFPASYGAQWRCKGRSILAKDRILLGLEILGLRIRHQPGLTVLGAMLQAEALSVQTSLCLLSQVSDQLSPSSNALPH